METNEIMNLIHILIVGPILINVGYRKKTTSNMIFNILLIIGVAVMIYHTYLFFKQLNKKAVKEQFDTIINEQFQDQHDNQSNNQNEQINYEVTENNQLQAFNGYINYSELN